MQESFLYLDIEKAEKRPSARAPAPKSTVEPVKTTPKTPGKQIGAGGEGSMYVPCPYGGGKECIQNGGNGSLNHKRGGTIMQAHAAAGSKPSDSPELKTEEKPEVKVSKEEPTSEDTDKEVSKEEDKRLVSSGAKEPKTVSSSGASSEERETKYSVSRVSAADLETIKQREADPEKFAKEYKDKLAKFKEKNPNWQKDQYIGGKTYDQHLKEAEKHYYTKDWKKAAESAQKAKIIFEKTKGHPALTDRRVKDIEGGIDAILQEAKKNGVEIKEPESESSKSPETKTKKPAARVSEASEGSKGKKPSSSTAKPTGSGDKKRAEVAKENAEIIAQKKKDGGAPPPTGPVDTGDGGDGPDEEDETEDVKKPKDSKVKPTKKDIVAPFRAGRVTGTRLGEAAATGEAGGYLVSAGVEYGVGGAIKVGQHLLDSDRAEKVKRPSTGATRKPVTPRQPGSEVEQSSMKSLPLYVDLQKAIQMPNAGVTTPSDRQAKREHDASYAKRPVGVANEGIVTEDDPDKGKRWKHDEEDSVQSSVDDMLSYKEEDKDKDEEETTKSLFNPSDMLKSLNQALKEEVSCYVPNSLEADFMIHELGYDPIRVSKGLCSISGKNRHRFNEWMNDRLKKSISYLSRISGAVNE